MPCCWKGANWERFSVVAAFQLTQIVERLVNGAHLNARNSPRLIQIAEEKKIFEIRGRFQLATPIGRQLLLLQGQGIHVMRDEELGAFSDEAVKSRQSGLDVVVRFEAFADVVQRGCQKEFLIVGPVFASQLENLQRRMMSASPSGDTCAIA